MKLLAKALRQWVHSAQDCGNKTMKNFYNKKGQSLVELGTLGALLIFCLGILLRYGMNANHQEDVAMRSFRKAFARARSYDIADKHSRYAYENKNDKAYQLSQIDAWWAKAMMEQYPKSFVSVNASFDPNWEYENKTQDTDKNLLNPPLPSNNWREVSYTVVEDRPMPSASGILPVAERSAFSATNSALWSIDVFDKPLIDNGQYQYHKLPRVEYEINGKRYSFTTAGFNEVVLDQDTGPIKIKEDIENWNGQGQCWRPKEVERLEVGDSVDLDGDSYEETVLESKTSVLKVIDDEGNNIKVADPKKYIIALSCTYSLIDVYYARESGENIVPEYKGNASEDIVTTRASYRLSEEEVDAALKDFTEILVQVYSGDFSGEDLYMYKKIKIEKWQNALKLLDQQEGEIDLSRTEDILARGGLKSDSLRRETTSLGGESSKFIRKEDAGGIVTTDEIRTQETISRIIKTVPDYGYWDRNGTYHSPAEGRLEVKDEFKTQKTETWNPGR